MTDGAREELRALLLDSAPPAGVDGDAMLARTFAAGDGAGADLLPPDGLFDLPPDDGADPDDLNDPDDPAPVEPAEDPDDLPADEHGAAWDDDVPADAGDADDAGELPVDPPASW